jgi:hypothetical protein
VYWNKNNFELDRKFNSPNVICAVKSNRLRYAGLIIRGAEDLPQRALFRAVAEGRGTEGRHKFKWTDDVNSNSKA